MPILMVSMLFIAGMRARSMLAALDNNNNVGRPQATIKAGPKKGSARFYTVCPKGRKGWVAKPVFQEKNYSYVDKLMTATRDLCSAGQGTSEQLPVRDLPPYIATEERPPKEDVVEKHKSRFERQK